MIWAAVGSNSVKCYAAFSALKCSGLTARESGCLCLMSQLKFTRFCLNIVSSRSFIHFLFSCFFIFTRFLLANYNKHEDINKYRNTFVLILRSQARLWDCESLRLEINPFEVYLILAKASPFPLVFYKSRLCTYCCLKSIRVWFGPCWCWIWWRLAPTCWGPPVVYEVITASPTRTPEQQAGLGRAKAAEPWLLLHCFKPSSTIIIIIALDIIHQISTNTQIFLIFGHNDTRHILLQHWTFIRRRASLRCINVSILAFSMRDKKIS